MLTKKISVLAVSLALSACGSVSEVRKQIIDAEPVAKRALQEPMHVDEQPRVVEMRGTMLPVTESAAAQKNGAWLRTIRFGLNAPRPVSLSAAVTQMGSKGINVSSDLPLDRYTFTGVINETDAEAALRQLLGSIGLDYYIDDQRKLVTIKPMASRTWYLPNIGRRTASYSSPGVQGVSSSSSNSPNGQNGQNGQSGASGAIQGTQANSGAGGQGNGAAQNGAGGNGQGGSGGSQGQASNSGGSGTTGVSSSENFWSSLDTELRNRLSVMVPTGSNAQSSGMSIGGGQPLVPALQAMQGAPIQSLNQMVPQANPMQGDSAKDGSPELYVKKKIGDHTVNPDTGAVWIQAPHWVLREMDVYIKRVQQMYDSEMSFQGELVLVSSTDDNSEGLDIQEFARFASGRFGAVLANNAMGGVTISFPNGVIPQVSANAQAVAGPLLGITSPKDGLQVFNNYLKAVGKFSVKQTPILTTTNGVPGQVNNKTPIYFNSVSQSAAAGNTGAAQTATTNTLQRKDFGTVLRINPRYDIVTGLVRAQVDIDNTVFAGNQNVPQVVSVGNSVQTVNQLIPLDKNFGYNGEALLRDGDLIILGGQSEDTLQTDESGIPGGGAVPLGGIFGTKKSSNARNTYYFALHVSVKKR
jgi:type II secretory pathway component GspD/PulD (secretin)